MPAAGSRRPGVRFSTLGFSSQLSASGADAGASDVSGGNCQECVSRPPKVIVKSGGPSADEDGATLPPSRSASFVTSGTRLRGFRAVPLLGVPELAKSSAKGGANLDRSTIQRSDDTVPPRLVAAWPSRLQCGSLPTSDVMTPRTITLTGELALKSSDSVCEELSSEPGGGPSTSRQHLCQGPPSTNSSPRPRSDPE